MYNKAIIEFGSVDNTLLDLQNSPYPTQPHSIIAKYTSMNKKINAMTKTYCESVCTVKRCLY